MDSRPVPWFAPKVSPALNTIVRNLGHRVDKSKGDVLYETGSMFERLMYVQSGTAARAVLMPGFEDTPFFVLLALQGSLIGCVETLYSKDSVMRRQGAVNNCEVLTIPKEILLKLADHEPSWHKELAGYNAATTLADRIGLMVTREGDPHQRLGSFIYAYCSRSGLPIDEELRDEKKDWLALPSFPPRKLIGQVIGCETSLIDKVVEDWQNEGSLKKIHRNALMRRTKLCEYFYWLQRFI